MKRILLLLFLGGCLVGHARAQSIEKRVYPLLQERRFTYLDGLDPNNWWDDVNDVYTIEGLLNVVDVNVSGSADFNDVNAVSLSLPLLAGGYVLGTVYPDGAVGTADGGVLGTLGDATWPVTYLDPNGTFDTDPEDFYYDPTTDTLHVAVAAPLGMVLSTSRYTSTQTLGIEEYVIFCDTDGGGFTINLPAGTDGKAYRIINTGTSGNAVTLAPNGTNLLFGVNASMSIYDGEVFDVVYETTEGWF